MHQRIPPRSRAGSPAVSRVAVLLVAALVLFASLGAAQGPPRITASAALQIDALTSIKTSKSASQNKIDSRLFMAILKARQDPRLSALPDFRYVAPDADGKIAVDVEARKVSDVKAVLARISTAGGQVQSFEYKYRMARARVPISAIEGLASLPGVRKIQLAQKPFTHAINTSEGDVAHRAAEARNFFGVNGAGVKICVLSDGVDSLAALQASGDLPAVDVLPGEAGSGDEGSAMLEIIHDLAPGATLGFATAFTSISSFAANIIALQADGCHIIVDDIIYLIESPFQDVIVADAVNQVTAAGALYFSSAGNEGNFNDGSSGTWEGDFNANGTVPSLPGAGVAHDFGDNGQSQLVTGDSAIVTLHWTDAFGASGNDYDVYDMDGGLTTVFDASTDVQDGDDDPVEISGFAFAGERLVVMQFAGVDRMINLNNFRGTVALQTTGCIRGHNSAADAFAVAAVDVADAAGPGGAFNGTESVEPFSCDGLRRIFFDFAGNLLPGAPPGNFSQTGGVVRQKPEIAAADGVATASPGFNPFFGTSAAAPHAAAIAGLVKQAFPAFTPAQVRTALVNSALDIEAPGVDRDSGAGIVMAYETLEDNGAQPQAFLTGGTPVFTQVGGDGDAFVEPGEDWGLTIPLTNGGGAAATAISAVLTSSTPGVTILAGSSTYPDLAPAASASNATPYVFTTNASVACGGLIEFTLTVSYTGGPSPQTINFTAKTGSPGTPVTISYAGPAVPIPDGFDLSGTLPGAPVAASLVVAGVVGNVYDVDFRIDGDTCSAAIGSTTVGIDHTFVNDLELTVLSPGGGPTVLAIDNTDGSDNNFCQTTLDDESGGPSIQSVGPGQSPYTGSFTPNAALSGFDGLNPNGTWQLQAQDFFSQDTGNIRAFSLVITPAVCNAAAVAPNVTATKTVSGGDLAAGGTVIYTVTLTNNGTGVQPNNPTAEFTDTLPATLTVGTPTASSGTVSGAGVNPVTWNGTIAPGASVTITIPATIQAGTGGQTISNQGTVSFDANRDFTNETNAPTDAPGGTVGDPTTFPVVGGGVSPVEIPTLSEIGLALLVLMLSASAVFFMRRRTQKS
jgi:uncharacterized repeat protein (TIGR01451 family)